MPQENNVVKFEGPKVLRLQLDQLAGYEGVKILSALIREWNLVEKKKLNVLARRANLCTSTVAKIMSRETKSPRLLTCVMLFKALGFTAVRIE